jgi:hypothetical protein
MIPFNGRTSTIRVYVEQLIIVRKSDRGAGNSAED